MAGVFITGEGIDCCGKSTQLELLENKLQDAGIKVAMFREPGGTSMCEEIRKLLLHKDEAENIAPWTECLLYTAARAQLVHEKAVPVLEQVDCLLIDRYRDSTEVYQGIARGLGAEEVILLTEITTGGFMPDLTFYFDIDFKTSRQRKINSGTKPDRLERQPDEFHKALIKGYRSLVKKYPERIVMIDGNQSIEDVHQSVLRVVNERFDFNL
ncbi:dTMP kinase [candidate division WS5 bacterium]|uniref:Thymidylate kinase n=1 Tax=candidate division WS5 bacterium TaxID=2093353 RepID=A0A419DEE5_9BACT|nr:MAG: dTMP kinase [candidate division WS5 bacterium]